MKNKIEKEIDEAVKCIEVEDNKPKSKLFNVFLQSYQKYMNPSEQEEILLKIIKRKIETGELCKSIIDYLGKLHNNFIELGNDYNNIITLSNFVKYDRIAYSGITSQTLLNKLPTKYYSMLLRQLNDVSKYLTFYYDVYLGTNVNKYGYIRFLIEDKGNKDENSIDLYYKNLITQRNEFIEKYNKKSNEFNKILENEAPKIFKRIIKMAEKYIANGNFTTRNEAISIKMAFLDGEFYKDTGATEYFVNFYEEYDGNIILKDDEPFVKIIKHIANHSYTKYIKFEDVENTFIKLLKQYDKRLRIKFFKDEYNKDNIAGNIVIEISANIDDVVKEYLKLENSF